MFCFKQFARRQDNQATNIVAPRAVSLIEVMVSQVVVLILIAGLMSLVVSMVKSLNSETNVSDAQVRLRQATHLFLRDTQGIGGDSALSGDMVTVVDNVVANGGSDLLTVFKRDESMCNGGLLGTQVGPGSRVMNVGFVAGVCPITASISSCSEAELSTRRVTIRNGAKFVEAQPTTPNASSCNITFGTAENAAVVAAYNARFGTSLGNIGDVISDIGSPLQILVGTSFSYRVVNSGGSRVLQRSLNGAAFEIVLDNVFDLQIERVFDIDGDGNIDAGEVITASTGNEPAAATSANFLGVRIGLVTFGRAADGIEIRPPGLFSNHDLTAAPLNRRYRASFIFAAARNRTGV